MLLNSYYEMFGSSIHESYDSKRESNASSPENVSNCFVYDAYTTLFIFFLFLLLLAI